MPVKNAPASRAGLFVKKPTQRGKSTVMRLKGGAGLRAVMKLYLSVQHKEDEAT